METARQTLRWAIPGWLFFLFLGLFLSIQWGFDQKFPSADMIMTRTEVKEFLKDQLAPLAAGLTLIGIPVGFVLYQVYYYMRWRGPVFLRMKPDDAGFCMLCGLGMEEHLRETFGRAPRSTVNTRYTPTKRWAALRSEPAIPTVVDLMPLVRTGNRAQQLRLNWYLAKSAWVALIQDKELSGVASSNTYMADIYHALGASRAGLLGSFVAYCGYELVFFAFHQATFEPVAILVNLILCAGTFLLFTSTRQHAYMDFLSQMRDMFLKYSPHAHLSSARPENAPCESCILWAWGSRPGNLPPRPEAL